jgi:hypothetical protein
VGGATKIATAKEVASTAVVWRSRGSAGRIVRCRVANGATLVALGQGQIDRHGRLLWGRRPLSADLHIDMVLRRAPAFD